jgi:thiol-disulfide isomerase/thioredoxin
VRLAAEVTLVALWTTWCEPCRAEMPRLQALSSRHAPEGLGVVAIAMHLPDDATERHVVRQFLSRERIRLPAYFVDERAYEQLEALLREAGRPGLVVPTVLVVDRERRVRAVFRGREVAALATALPKFLPPRASVAR